MNREYLIIPHVDALAESAELAAEFDAAFEYNDFFAPAVYDDPDEVARRVQAYRSLPRDRSRDTLHGAFFDVRFTSADPVIRARSRQLMRQSIDIAEQLGVRAVVFHSDIFGGVRLRDEYNRAWLADAEALFRQLCAEAPGLDLLLENTVEAEPGLLVALAEALSDVPNFGLCLDYAHANLQPTPNPEWVRAMGPYVRHVHLNDNDGIADLHEACGTRHLDFDLFARQAGAYLPGVPILLEVSSLAQARASLEFMATLPDEPAAGHPAPPLANPGIFTPEQLLDVVETNLALVREKDKTALLDLILTKSMELSNCDAGTLYELRDGALHFMIMKTRSLGLDRGGDGTEIDLPPVTLDPANVCAYAALNARTMNIADVYDAEESGFDFSGPKRYDAMTGYRTGSMLTVPLADDEGSVLGVMQLINAQDAAGATCPFAPEQERLLAVLAAGAAITMRQLAYVEQLREQMWSFAAAMAEAIDQRTPYNASHTRHVAEYSERIARKLNEQLAAGGAGGAGAAGAAGAAGGDPLDEPLSEARIQQLVMAAWLHDIGKMVVPTAVMDKPTRLGPRIRDIEARFELIRARLRLAAAEGHLAPDQRDGRLAALDAIWADVQRIDTAGFLPPADRDLVASWATLELPGDPEAAAGDPQAACPLPYFTPEELALLAIPKGTLSDDERAAMQGHVTATERILQKVRFNAEFASAPTFAAQHHELLDGSGYPRGLAAADLPLETRILTVADIADALLADDRPYKAALPRDRAFGILHSMAAEGKLEERLVAALESCLEKEER